MTTTLRIEKLIDPNTNPVGASEQTRQPWCSPWSGAWAVFGTEDANEAKAFIREFLNAGPALGNPDTMGSTTILDWTKD